MIKLKSSIKENWQKFNMYYLAFLIPFCAMFLIFVGNQIYPFGDRSFLHIDMYHQYFPFLVDFFHKMKEGESLAYTWNAGIGSNFIALFAYYLASPLNWFCLLVPEAYLMEFMSYLVVIKTGLCGLTAAVYLSKHFQKKNKTVVLFSTFYAMSGFMAAYNWNVMWLDCIVLTPLIILGLEVLVKEGKYKLYCICLGLAILSNYYICIMICAYLVLYFFLILLPFANHKLKAFGNFCWASLLAGGMGALFLIPAAFALQLSKFSSASFPTTVKTYFSIFDMLARHFMYVDVEIGLDHWPNLYCSVAVLLLIPIYILAKNISVKKKFVNLFLLFFMFISFSNNMLNFIWHGMNYPDSLPSRQSFLYILLVLTLAYEGFMHLKEISKQEYTYIFTGLAIFMVLAQKLITDDGVKDLSYLLTVIFLLAYGILIYIYVTQKNFSKYLIWIAILAVFVESGCNMILTSVSTVSRDNYLHNYEVYNKLWEKQMAEDEGEFYRYDKKNRITNNDSMLHNYPSVSLFSSTTNGLVNHFYSRYGMRNSKVYYCSDGMTPFMSSLLSVGYTFGKGDLQGNPLYSKRQQEMDVCLYQNHYSLPMGFCIYPDEELKKMMIEDEETAFAIIEEGSDEDLLPIPNQNRLAMRLGADEGIFDEIVIQPSMGNITANISENGNVYAYLTQKQKEVTLYVDGIEGQTFKKLNNNYILDLGYLNGGSEIELRSSDGTPIFADVYMLKQDVLSDLLGKLNENTLEIHSMEADELKGNVSAKEDGYLILSIPYDPGFTVKVDGRETEIELFEEMMLAVPLAAGEHEIELYYKVPGMNLGIAVSVVSILIFVGIILWEKKKTRRNSMK